MSVSVNSMVGLKVANNGILAAMSRGEVKDMGNTMIAMIMRFSLQVITWKRTREVDRWSRPRNNDSEG